MELGIETKVEGTILERGKIALDAKLFSDIIRKLSGENSTITIESDEKYNTTITCVRLFSRLGQGRLMNFLYSHLERVNSSHFPSLLKRDHPPDDLLDLAERQQQDDDR